MTKYKTVWCEGYWQDSPHNIYEVLIALDSFDGLEDEDDELIFYYMDNEPLMVGTILSDGFVITLVGDIK